MRIGNTVILPWSRKNFIPRIIAIAIIIAWFVWGYFLYQENQRLIERARVWREQQQSREYQRSREERQRRAAAYERRQLEEQAIRGGVQNAIDGVKK